MGAQAFKNFPISGRHVNGGFVEHAGVLRVRPGDVVAVRNADVSGKNCWVYVRGVSDVFCVEASADAVLEVVSPAE